jgi:hypothetical protein
MLLAGLPQPPLWGCYWQDESYPLGGGPSDGVNVVAGTDGPLLP